VQMWEVSGYQKLFNAHIFEGRTGILQ
jgi:hypothetical protein